MIAHEATDLTTASQQEPFEGAVEHADTFDTWRDAVDKLLGCYNEGQRRALLPPASVVVAKEHRRKLARENGPLRSVRSGESAIWMSPMPRWLVDYFLAEHIGSRLRLLRRCILIADRLTNDEQDQLLARIDRLLPAWPERPVVGLLYRYVLPLSAIIAAAWHFLLTGLTDPENTVGLFMLLSLYTATFLGLFGLAFVSKRGLMLGGSGIDAGVPASLDGQGTYALEALVFGTLAPPRREAPLDLLLLAAAVPLFLWGFVIGLLLSPLPPWVLLAAGLGLTTGWIPLNILAFIRRRQLGRR